MKTLAHLLLVTILTTFAGLEARADFNCYAARQRLEQAYAGLARAQAMAANPVAICGQSTSCYMNIAAAVNIAQQAVNQARQEVFYCRRGR